MTDDPENAARLADFRLKVQDMSEQQLLDLAMQLKQTTQHLSEALQIISERLACDQQKRGN
jgi:hypothetical protein